MIKRKYPTSMFIFGLIINLIKTWYLAAISILIHIIRIVIPIIPFWVSIIFLSAWLIIALVWQLELRNLTLAKSDDEEFDELFDKVFDKNNPNWSTTLKEHVNEKIEQYNNTNQSNES